VVNYLSYPQIEQAVVSAARRRGFDGSPLAEPPLILRSAEHELAAADIVLDCPKRVRVVARSLVIKMARSIVHSSTAHEALASSTARRRA
jgi:hypothetical protein